MERQFLGRPVKKDFMLLWNRIPDVYTYREYISLMNEIDWARNDRLISASEEDALTGCLTHWAKTMRIPTSEEEYEQMYH